MSINLYGTIKARGLLSPEVQRVLLHHCQTGRAEEVKVVVAGCLLSDGLLDRSIPEPRGKKTSELLERASDAVQKSAKQYASSCGVLCARGFCSPEDLSTAMLVLWESSFSSALRTAAPSGLVVTEDSLDMNARHAVAAQVLLEIFDRYRDPQNSAVVIPISAVERVCSKAVRAMYEAFLDPDEAVHRRLHGEDQAKRG